MEHQHVRKRLGTEGKQRGRRTLRRKHGIENPKMK